MADSLPRWLTRNGAAPARAAFHVERVIDPFTKRETIGMVRHAGHAWQAAAPADLAQWPALGARYLQDLAQALGWQPGQPDWLPQRVWDALVPPAQRVWDALVPPAGESPGADSNGGLRWLPLDDAHPWGSFRVARSVGADLAVADHSVVLLAGCIRFGLQLGSDMGLRITAHVRDGLAHVHGLTLSGLSGEHALHSMPSEVRGDKALYALVQRIKPAIGQALGDGRWVWINSLERLRRADAPAHVLRVGGYLARAQAGSTMAPRGDAAVQKQAAGTGLGRLRVHDFCVDVDVAVRRSPRVVAVHRNEFAGSAAQADADADAHTFGHRRAFLADAASQGPADTLRQRRTTRQEAELSACRSDVGLWLDNQGTLSFGDGTATLFESRGARRDSSGQVGNTMQVSDAAVVQVVAPQVAVPSTAATAQAAQHAAPAPEQFWTDDQASVETHVRAAELFARMSAYGIDPNAYFRFARLPLVQRARAALRWAPDGDVPNAEVRPFLGDDDTDDAQSIDTTAARLQLLVKYGSADPWHRRQVPLAEHHQTHQRPLRADGVTPRSRAQYLGVASDPRWAWHEFGHVLNYASTGELEFPFAHSAGDALGAIACDPLSQLASADAPEDPMRFVSFPWIEVPGRSHGRAALQGYCWCGRRNLVRLDAGAPLDRHHHGYYEEQMLSSSLFRLYRCLGGDTRGGDVDVDEAIRLEASDYCIWLIMRAISLLGPDSVAPARTADQFVSALIDADLGTGAWHVVADWPYNRSRRTLARQGGQVHKVVRWAFERQGLYATDDPTVAADAIGQAPAVDVFIADRRNGGPDAHPGGYAPVPLRADGGDWLAAADAVRRTAGGVAITLCNRGQQASGALRLRLWWGTPIGTGSLAWQTQPIEHEVPSVPKGGAVTAPVGCDKQAAGWLLVAVDADADPSNLPLDGTPPANRLALMHLVANDNNLALIALPAAT